MNLRRAVTKLIAASAALIGLIALWIIDRHGPFGAAAAVLTIVLAGPIELLVAIDATKALRSAGSHSALLGLPELTLGSLACVGSAGGFWLLFFGNLKSAFFVWGCFVSGALLLLGARWLRSGRQAVRERSS